MRSMTTFNYHPNPGNLSNDDTRHLLAIRNAVSALRARGVIVTVENTSQFPPRMGAYDTVISVRRAIDHRAEAAKRGGYTLNEQDTTK